MIQPRLLASGDRVAIVAPAGSIEKTAIDRAIEILESWDLELVLGRHVYGRHGYFSGTDEERLSDLQNALDDPTVAAIVVARGGYGTTRILDNINLDSLKASPKWLIGFSDITALHLKILQSGGLSIHGDMGTTLGRHKASTEALNKLLFEGTSSVQAEEIFRQGTAEGVLTGGNLALVVDSMGTASEIDSRQRILFLEEVGEKTYRVDRMLQQLARSGKLANLAGLVVGQFSEITEGPASFGSTWKECIKHVVSEYDYPVAFSFPIGHEAQNYPVIHGAKYRLEVTGEKATLNYTA